jgi:hypothetical protein
LCLVSSCSRVCVCVGGGGGKMAPVPVPVSSVWRLAPLTTPQLPWRFLLLLLGAVRKRRGRAGGVRGGRSGRTPTAARVTCHGCYVPPALATGYRTPACSRWSRTTDHQFHGAFYFERGCCLLVLGSHTHEKTGRRVRRSQFQERHSIGYGRKMLHFSALLQVGDAGGSTVQHIGPLERRTAGGHR